MRTFKFVLELVDSEKEKQKFIRDSKHSLISI